MHAASNVFFDAAGVVQRVWQATGQCSEMIDAPEKAGNAAVLTDWLNTYELCNRIADDKAPVRREALTAARAVLRTAQRK